MTTCFSAVVDAIVGALRTAPAVSANVFRQRLRPFTAEMDDGVNVLFEGAIPAPGEITGAPVDWSARIVVEIYARSNSTTGDVAVDDLLGTAYARLAADRTLGGSIDDLGEPDIQPEVDELGQRTGVMKLTYAVQRRTSNNTLE